MKLTGLGIYLRGIAMGAADLVPGVSGGTIALITGIYARLITAIASIGPSTLSLLLRGKLMEAWKAIDGQFLFTLAAGIATAIIGLAAVLDWLLQHYLLPLWATFSGLVLASALSLVRDNYRLWSSQQWSMFLIGIGVAVFVGLTQAVQMPVTPWGIFLAGSVAICAMILPGISGSFLLLLLGMYQVVISAIVNLEFTTLALFALGCGVGILLFSRFASTAFVCRRTVDDGNAVWIFAGLADYPMAWQVTVSSVLDRHGEMRAVQKLPVTPGHYAEYVGDPMLLLSAVGFIVGTIAVMLLMSISRRHDQA